MRCCLPRSVQTAVRTRSIVRHLTGYQVNFCALLRNATHHSNVISVRMVDANCDACVVCDQCGVRAFPHSSCRCRRCGRRHLKTRLPCSRAAAAAHGATQLSLLSHRQVCSQCGELSYPHTQCRCGMCGCIHVIGNGCIRPDRQPARRATAVSMFKAAMKCSTDPPKFLICEMSESCPFCGARKWPKEKLNCCANGEIQLAPLPDVPPNLQSILYSPHVMEHIRSYNMSLAMVSVGHCNKSLPDGMFHLGGKSYHRIGSMYPEPNSHHAFAQIYVLDVELATDRRVEIFGGHQSVLRRETLAALHNWMLHNNPLIRQFSVAARGNVPTLVWRCEDDISTMQIGTIVVEPGSRRDIVVHRIGGVATSIDDGHPLYHPLAYPLLFPFGTPGWQSQSAVHNVDLTNARSITLTEWGRYMLMHRGNVTHLQKCQKLTMEYYCDLWAQIEARNAYFHRSDRQQAKYRAARVAAFEDQLSSGTPASEIGQPVIRLPSSFVGSARYYQQLYLDAMALPKKFGKPDLFVTFTCNPHWPEIVEALPNSSHWKFHADVVSRAFMIRLKSLLNDIVKLRIFGDVSAYVYRIEWQARGLPHAHILIILKDKILSTRHIDNAISAEIPDPVAEPELHSLVTSHMLHPECDQVTTCSCRRDNHGSLRDCQRHFPKDMSSETVIIPDGYPRYRRRGKFSTQRRSGRIVTDNWVVPYNRCESCMIALILGF